MKTLSNIHPGEILEEEFLLPLKISAYKVAKDIGIPQTRISEILKQRRSITADTALRLSKWLLKKYTIVISNPDSSGREISLSSRMRDFSSLRSSK